MVASICYHEQLFDQEVRRVNAEAVLSWRARFTERLEAISKQYPPQINVSLEDLADMLSVVADGGIILSKVVSDKQHFLANYCYIVIL